MNLDLQNKNVLITGSTNGLGKTLAYQFAMEGANPIIVGRNKNNVDALTKHIHDDFHVKSFGICTDLSLQGNPEKLFQEAVCHFEHIDILINNAGIWPQAYVKDMDIKDFEDTLHINLTVPFILSKLMTNHLIEQKKTGKIIHIASQAAFHGSTTGHAHYAASKAGLIAFMKSHAREVAKYGININAVAPGIMLTKMIESQYSNHPDYYNNRIPIGRPANAEEVASVVLFLASSKANYLTGATIDCTGGMLMH